MTSWRYRSSCRLIMLVSFLLALFQTHAQSRSSDIIPIAIPDARPFGVDNPTPEQVKTIEVYTALITTEVAGIPYFDVLERKQANELYNEIAYQLQTGGELTDAVANTRLRGARAILITGFGELFGRIVVTARLVDLQTGRVLFAETIYADPISIDRSLRELAASMREKGSELGMTVRIEDIERAVKARSWKDAKRLADLFLRSAPGDERVRVLYESIAKNRARELHADAKRLVRLRLFKEARIAIDEAIALSPQSEYYAYRDTIGQAELDYQYKQKADLQRREDALKTGRASQGFWRRATDHIATMTTSETRIGASFAPRIQETPDLTLKMDDGDWGFDIAWVNAYQPASGMATRVWSWYAGFYGAYEMVEEGGRGTTLGAFISPLAAQSLRLGPIILHFGLDGGGFLAYGPYAGEQLQYGLSAGALAELSIRLNKRFGIFSALKIDWRQHLREPDRSGPMLRLSAGITL